MLTCKDCGWLKLLDAGDGAVNGNKKGRCHARAPIATPVVMPVMNQITSEVTPQIIEVTLWPVVGLDCEACGDFEPVAKVESCFLRLDRLKEPE